MGTYWLGLFNTTECNNICTWTWCHMGILSSHLEIMTSMGSTLLIKQIGLSRLDGSSSTLSTENKSLGETLESLYKLILISSGSIQIMIVPITQILLFMTRLTLLNWLIYQSFREDPEFIIFKVHTSSMCQCLKISSKWALLFINPT